MRLFGFYLSHGLLRVCEIKLSDICKNKGNPDLVCENIRVDHSFELINICCGPRSMLPNAEGRTATVMKFVIIYMSSSNQNDSAYTKLPD